MKITCTQKEKDLLIKAIVEGKGCPFDTNTVCIKDCYICMKQRIAWNVKDGEQE